MVDLLLICGAGDHAVATGSERSQTHGDFKIVRATTLPAVAFPVALWKVARMPRGGPV